MRSSSRATKVADLPNSNQPMKTKSLLLSAALAAFLVAVTGQASPSLDDARAALKANRLADAETILVPLTGTDAPDAAAFHLLSQVRLAQNNSVAAIDLAERATKLDATNPAYFSQLGLALSRRMGEIPFMQQAFLAGKLKHAFEKTIELDPHHVGGLIGLTRYYTNAPAIAGGSLEKAQEFAVRLEEIVPFLGEMELANIAAHAGKYADALAHYDAALRLNPNLAEAQDQGGRMLLKLKRNAEARTRFVAALSLDPTLESAKKALAELDTAKPQPGDSATGGGGQHQ